jgi:Ca2+-binding RTX toxin-like protein
MRRLTQALAATILAGSLLVAFPVHAEDGPTGAHCGPLPATLVGTPGDDVLVGTSEVDVIVGLEGNDTISGLGDSDVLCGGFGDDVLLGGSGDDELRGGFGASVLSGGAGADRMVGVLALDADTQSVSGGPGRDYWFLRFVSRGGPGSIDGTTGKVNLRRDFARSTDSFVVATMPVRGIEEVEVTRGRWTLIGSGLSETLLGHTKPGAPVTIHAGAGRDVLRGTRNDDLLDGGRGVDTVRVTPGDDTCRHVERFVNGVSC